jgi:lipopolysaccharide transport system permease protein
MLNLTLWLAFIDALNGPICAMSEEKVLLAKCPAPPEALVMANLGEVIFNFSARSLLTGALFARFAIPVGGTIFLVPVGVASIILLGTAIGLVLAPVNALYQDVAKGLPVVTAFWFFLTPVLYPVLVEGALAVIVWLNSLTPLLVAVRGLVTGVSCRTHPGSQRAHWL